ncbi:MAG: Gmad2 immunoglobulin-like domain-containing protein [bacterium]|nr:Gmad2 immunoglobulin-like domain-containing protein [bacterium]
MTDRQKKGIKQILVGVILLAVAGLLYWFGNRGETAAVDTFDECAAEGFPVMESYPRQCRVPDGETFREEIGNELEKDNLIRIEAPRPNSKVTSPLVVRGMARGNWFFEASFPLKLLDGNGKEIAVSHAQAQADPATGEVNWMTTEFVPFEGKLMFSIPETKEGTLILAKDNPSGLPEHDDSLIVPVRFR